MSIFKRILSHSRFYIPQIGKHIKMDNRQINNICDKQCLNIESEKIKIRSCNDPKSIKLAVDILIAGDVIALPTDTVYGLACDANNCTALKKLYDIKARNETQPTAICVSDLYQFRKFTISEHLPDGLLNSLLPGPVTIILYKSEFLSSPYLNPGSKKIGVRIPDYAFIRAVTNSCGVPLALTSANLRGAPSSLKISEFSIIWNKLAVIFDGGNISDNPLNRVASTIIDLSRVGYFSILRKGIACRETEIILHKYGLEKV